jgi:hypothetical protein
MTQRPNLLLNRPKPMDAWNVEPGQFEAKATCNDALLLHNTDC